MEEQGSCEKYMKAFADRLRLLRNKKKISAREMSLALGQNVNYINLIENGKRFPSLQGFFSICDYLDIHPSLFFSFTEVADDSTSKKLNFANKELVNILSQLTELQSSAVIYMLNSFFRQK